MVYGVSIVVQHGAAHTGTGEEDPHGLLQLLRNPRWLLAIGGDVVGFALQIAALSLGPVVLIQPLVVLMLPVALVTGSFVGGPRPTTADYISMAADPDLSMATTTAIQEMVDFLAATKKLTRHQAYQVISLAGNPQNRAAD